MGRPTKLTPTLQKQLVAALKTGATVVDVCKSVGLGKATFYEWLAIGEAVIDGTKHARMPEDPTEQKRFVDFVDAVTRAQEDAKMSAIKTLRTAMNPYTETTKSTKTFKETRLKRDGTEYQYVRVEESKTTVRRQGDWRAAVEYLKRRYKDEWGDRLEVDWRRELEQAGLDPDAQLDELTRQFEEHLRRGASAVDAGSAEACTGAS